MENQSVLLKKTGSVFSIILNRPDVINSLNRDMVVSITHILLTLLENPECRLVLFYGMGQKGFCAGGDIKKQAVSIKNKDFGSAMDFFRDEYELDILIHRFHKPIVIIADGITMGGGLGLAAGADVVIATERSVMAMPETRIGFFPDVGATGWMFMKCSEGYPEFIGLTGYEMKGAECVRVGFATNLAGHKDLPEIIKAIESIKINESFSGIEVIGVVESVISRFSNDTILENPGMDEWVSKYFHGKDNLKILLNDLALCGDNPGLCRNVFAGISERSPVALVLTLLLLRRNEGRILEDVFAGDLRADEFIIRHHDYYEGIRARLIDKDDKPRWDPALIDDVDTDTIKKILN